MIPDHLGDIDPISDLIDHIFRNQTSAHGSRGSYSLTSTGEEGKRKWS